MENLIEAKIWKLHDDIDTDIIIPTQYLAMKSAEDMKKYAFSPLRPELASLIQPNDILVAGRNFGCGSSREQAAEVIAALGVKCIIAKSFARIFYRNAFCNGIVLIENDQLPDLCCEGDRVSVDFINNVVLYGKERLGFPAIPADLLEMIDAGSLIAYMRKLNGL